MKRALISFLLCATSAQAFWASEEPSLAIQIKTLKTTNEGVPFYVFVKPTTFAQFVQEDYQLIVAEKIQPEKVEAGFEMTCLVPGETKQLTLPAKEHQAFALYCLLSTPGQGWKYFIDADGPSHVKVLLGTNEIQTVSRF